MLSGGRETREGARRKREEREKGPAGGKRKLGPHLEERARGCVSTGNLTKLDDEMMPQVRTKGTSGQGGGTRARMSTSGRYSVLTTYTS